MYGILTFQFDIRETCQDVLPIGIIGRSANILAHSIFKFELLLDVLNERNVGFKQTSNLSGLPTTATFGWYRRLLVVEPISEGTKGMPLTGVFFSGFGPRLSQ